MKLRYYGDSSLEADHRAVVDRLAAIHREWGVPVAVERVRDRHGPIEEFPGPVRDGTVERAYRRDFADNPVLAANVGHEPEEAFSTDAGLPTIAGCVGIVEEDDEGGFLLWATLLSGEPPGQELFSTGVYSLGFLDEVLESGPEALQARCANSDDVTPPTRLAGDAEMPEDVDVSVSSGVVDEETREELAEIIEGHVARRDRTRPKDRDPDGERSTATDGRGAVDVGATATDGVVHPGEREEGDGDEPADDGHPDATGGSQSTPGPVDRPADDDSRPDPADIVDAGRTDEDLLAEFVASAPAMDGADQDDVRLGVTVGEIDHASDRTTTQRSLAREFGTRTADAVIEAERDWVVVTASRLSARELDHALGEALVAERLYRSQEALDGDETAPAVLFDGLGRRADGPAEETLAVLADAAEYADAAGVTLFVRDPSIDGPLFRRLADYGSTPASVSMDSIAR